MKKLIFLQLLIIFLPACVFAPNKLIYVTPLSSEWNTYVYVSSYARVDSVLRVDYGQNKYRVMVSADFSLLVVGGEYKMCQKARDREDDVIQVKFWFDANDKEKHTYIFNNNKVWLTSVNGNRYHLQPTEYNSSKKISYQTYNFSKFRYPERDQYFQTPLLCGQLEGAVFELRGLYKDGVELPPIKFRINHKSGVL